MSLVAEGTPGATAVTVTHLIHEGPAPDVRPTPDGVRIVRVDDDLVASSARMYAAVGAQWNWVDRGAWSAEQWQAWVDRPGFSHWLLFHHDECAGYAELIAPEPGSVQIAFFGLLPEFVGRGLGAWWLEYVLDLAWQQAGAERVIVHTCELDHPSALPNYRARGFVPTHTEVEWRMVHE